MKDIYAVNVELEQTTPDKKAINLVFSYSVIHYIIRGTGFFNGKALHSGQAFICQKGKYCNYQQNPLDPWEYLYIELEGKDVAEYFSQYEKQEYIFHYSSPDKLLRLLEQMNTSTEFLYDRDYGKALYYMVSVLHEDYSLQQRFIPAGNKYVEAAKDYMERNFSMPITIGHVAEEVHVSRAYLRNLFAEYEKKSPKQYLSELRMYHAGQLLLKSELSVTEIAETIGYTDLFQFIKAFKKFYNISPSKYRQRER